MKTTAVLAAICAIIGTYAYADDMAEAPEAGTYAANVVVKQAGCHFLGNQLTGEVSFAGLDGSTNYIRVPANDVVSIQTLTIKDGKGTLSPSGKVSWMGRGFRTQWSQSGTFSATIKEVETHAFVMNLHEYFSGCTEKWNVSLVRFGDSQ